jgi:hypothetical protein
MQPFGMRAFADPADLNAKLLAAPPVVQHFYIRNEKVSYIEVGEVMKSANGIFGRSGWSFEITTMTRLYPPCKEGHIEYQCIGKVILQDGTSSMDVGSASKLATLPDAADFAMKAAVSDCIKRTLAHFGPALGLGLKSKPPTPVNREHDAFETALQRIERDALAKRVKQG